MVSAAVIVTINILLNSLSLFCVLKLTLWRERKYLQLAFLNFTSIFCGVTFALFISYRFITRMERMACMIGNQFFVFGLSWNSFSIISLSIDCFVAVYFPLRFRSLMTVKQFLWLNVSTYLFQAVALLSPIPIYGKTNDGYLYAPCDIVDVLPRRYIWFLFGMSFVLGLTVVVLNIGVATGVILALIRRNRMGAKDKSVYKKMQKLVLRLAAIIATNIFLNLPLLLTIVRLPSFFSDFESIPIALSNGVVNILIFGAFDADFRRHIKKMLQV